MNRLFLFIELFGVASFAQKAWWTLEFVCIDIITVAFRRRVKSSTYDVIVGGFDLFLIAGERRRVELGRYVYRVGNCIMTFSLFLL